MKPREHRCAYSVVRYLAVAILFGSSVLFAGCGGGGDSNPENADGFTLAVSGGTLNDGSGYDGLVILATIRDDQGWGPTLPWNITITGPGISSSSPLTADYNDSQPGSYQIWEWAGFEPLSGTYRATATDGTTTLINDFQINAGNTLSRPSISTSAAGSETIISWQQIANAASYYYEVCNPLNVCIYEYTTSTSINLGVLADTGDYLVKVRAHATDLVALDGSSSASPVLASQENVSEYSLSFPIGGDQTSTNYSFSAAGGLLDYDLSGPGGPIYGFGIWTSVQHQSPTSAPDGNWNIAVRDSSNTIVADFIYPAGTEHYAYWYYSIEPVIGETYTVTATYGTAQRTATFTIVDANPHLVPLGTNQIIGTLETNSDITLSWDSVTNAGSYYVSLWALRWDTIAMQYNYEEVWSAWVSHTGNSTEQVVIPNLGIDAGLDCDVYVTAHEVDMTAASPPSPAPTRADLAENYYGYSLPFTTP